MSTTPEQTPARTAALRIEHAGSVATIVIDRPPANAVNPAVIDEFRAVVPALATDESVRCIVVRGTGRFFVAGGDVAELSVLTEDHHRRMRGWVEVQKLLEDAPKPVIGALNGHALGGGAELALACDLRIMSEGATFGFPEMDLGLFPGAGGSQRLPRLVGVHRAKLMMIQARRFTAREAVAEGLVDMVASPDQFDRVVAETALGWAAKPTRAIALLKRSLAEGAAMPLAQALDREWVAVRELIQTEDAAEGTGSFLAKRKPVFRGR